ncbi:MAG: hypothetical protein LBS29_04490 [Endomicrobium sp.]|jgi:FtsH-binding integral membrane protein|nr:hypothetical protein [Endomicrobium sp.]
MIDEIIDVILAVIKQSITSITLPTGKVITKTFIFAFIILIVAILSKWLGFITFIKWEGALISTILFAGLVLVDVKGRSDVLNLYKVVRTKVKGGTK